MHIFTRNTTISRKDISYRCDCTALCWRQSRLPRNAITLVEYLFMVYLTMLSVTQTTQHRMAGWLVNNELEGCGRKRPWPDLRYHPAFACRDYENPRKMSVRAVGVPAEIRTECRLEALLLEPACSVKLLLWPESLHFVSVGPLRHCRQE
jgi:hypothetical protein